jgi:hypothetical protein
MTLQMPRLHLKNITKFDGSLWQIELCMRARVQGMRSPVFIDENRVFDGSLGSNVVIMESVYQTNNQLLISVVHK